MSASTFRAQRGAAKGSGPCHLYAEAATAIIQLAAARAAIAEGPHGIQKRNWLDSSSEY